MGESRLIWEIGPDGVELRELRERLSLDFGYLSRALHSLEGQGLVKIRPSRDDRRVRSVSLTKAGLEERAELDRLSDVLAARILESLPETQRSALVAAMREVERLLRANSHRRPAYCFLRGYADVQSVAARSSFTVRGRPN